MVYLQLHRKVFSGTRTFSLPVLITSYTTEVHFCGDLHAGYSISRKPLSALQKAIWISEEQPRGLYIPARDLKALPAGKRT